MLDDQDQINDQSANNESPESALALPWWREPGVIAPTICNVHPVTGEFMGTSLADPSPLEPGVWLTPAQAFLGEAPELVPGKAIVRRGDAWEAVDDHRGVTVYSTSNGAPTVWEALGELPDGYTLDEPGEFDKWENGGWVTDQAALNAAQLARASQKKTLLLQYAAAQIGALQDAVDLEIATEGEQAALKAWKTYRVYLNRVDVSSSVPADGAWPVCPDPDGAARWLTAQGYSAV